MTAKGTQVTLGLGAGAAPDYEGSNDYDAVPLLFVRVNWESGMYFHLEGNSMKLNLVPSPKWRLGPAVRYIRERDNVKDDEVDDLDKVDAAVMVGGFGGVRLGPWGVDLQVLQDVADGNEGVLATAAVSYTISVSKQMLVRTLLRMMRFHSCARWARS